MTELRSAIRIRAAATRSPEPAVAWVTDWRAWGRPPKAIASDRIAIHSLCIAIHSPCIARRSGRMAAIHSGRRTIASAPKTLDRAPKAVDQVVMTFRGVRKALAREPKACDDGSEGFCVGGDDGLGRVDDVTIFSGGHGAASTRRKS